VDLRTARQLLREQVKAEFQVVGPGQIRPWEIHLGAGARDRLKDQPLYLRVKFNTAEGTEKGTYYASWAIGSEGKTRPWKSSVMSLAPDAFHEFLIPPNLFDENGTLIIVFTNPNQTALLFSLEDGLEVLYRVGGFGPNFVRGLGVVLCWMALFAALGLAAASLLSFPVAAFLSLALLTLGLSSGTLSNVVSEGTIMGYDGENRTQGHSPADNVIVPAFRAALSVINLVEQFSPIDSLSTGRTITWAQLSLAVAQIVLLLGGLLGGIGIFIFNRRELATAQGNH
jgi:hypothetical protein